MRTLHPLRGQVTDRGVASFAGECAYYMQSLAWFWELMSPLDKNLLRYSVWWAHTPAWHPSCKPHLTVDESYPSQRSADRRALWAGLVVPYRGLSGVEADVVLLKVVFPHSTVSGIMNSVRMKMSICYVGGRPPSWSAIPLKTIEIKI